MRLTCGSKRVEKQIKDVEDKSDELRAQVSNFWHKEHFGQVLIMVDHASAGGKPAPRSRTSTTSRSMICFRTLMAFGIALHGV